MKNWDVAAKPDLGLGCTGPALVPSVHLTDTAHPTEEGVDLGQ